MADGTLAAIAFEDRMDTDGVTRIRGNKLVEVAPDGTQRTIWTSWNCFDYATVKGDDPSQGWTFANALDYDAAADAYYVGMRNFSSIAKVNRGTGACEWVLGTYGNTFTYAAGAPRFLHEHQFDVRGNHILVMDNDGAPGDVSRVLEYELDFTAMTATPVWSYTANPTVYTFVLGEPIRLADGGTFVNWSTAGQMERLDATGASIWKLNSGAGFAFGFQTLADTLYDGGVTP
jgi:Arylsulfotransferase (ASST)